MKLKPGDTEEREHVTFVFWGPSYLIQYFFFSPVHLSANLMSSFFFTVE